MTRAILLARARAILAEWQIPGALEEVVVLGAEGAPAVEADGHALMLDASGFAMRRVRVLVAAAAVARELDR